MSEIIWPLLLVGLLLLVVVLVIVLIMTYERKDTDAILHIDFTNDDGEFFKLEFLNDLDKIKNKKQINVKVDHKSA